VLRPSSGFLGSTRAVRARNLRKERVRAVGHSLYVAGGLGAGLLAGLVGLVLPLALPFLYFSAAFFTLVVPLRWLFGPVPPGLPWLLLWAGAAVVSIIGIIRAAQRQEPLAPVRPEFARAMLLVGWGAALVLALTDLVR
jgi:hypothetical protein